MTAPRQSQIPEIRALLQGRVLDLVRELAPDGHRAGQYWIARNPTRADDHRGSFWVRVAGSGIGVWADEATGDGAAQGANGLHKGDIIGLVQYCARLGSVGEALRWSRDFLQLGEMPEADRRRRAALVQQRQQQVDADEAVRLEKQRGRAMAMYIEARRRPFLGSCADVYLRKRGIDVRQLGRMPRVIGWLPGSGKPGASDEWPCMLAGFQDDHGRTVAVHRTFLTPDGDKAPVEHVRKIWPSFGGAAIRLWRGANGSIAEAARHGIRETLVLVEGVEDGLSVALAVPEMRIWCAGSLGNLSALALPECVDEVLVCADNDWGKPQARAQLDKALSAIAGQGRKVRVARSHVGKDVNDALRGQA